MKARISNPLSHALLALCITQSGQALANQAGASDPSSQAGGFLKIGYGYKFEQTPYHDEKNGAAMFLSGRYQFDFGLYLEASHGANELDLGNSLGFNFYNTEHWNFDLHAMQAHGETVMEFVFGVDDIPMQSYRMDRDETHMLGLRASGQYGQTSLQFIVAPYSFNEDYDDALFGSAWVAHTWQIKNWELYASLGANFRSSEIINHYYSTSSEIVDLGIPRLAAYDADYGVDVIGQIGLNYPVSRDLLFESYYRYTDVSDSIADSPVMKLFSDLDGRSDNVTEVGMLMSYVF